MYQALYRKWRPKTFADVIGQQHITKTLQHQIAEGRLSHAYLFTGTRGTGKTTCAKILAKAANCEHPVNGDPCNCCPSCLAIDSGSCLDVLELDAASNNGVDQMRALRDDAVYSPASVRKRVYIVDEVHMLTTSAFNAMLKILEEPPEHLIFILATTELQKVPATILSRCQRFSFKRILPSDIVKRLRYVAAQESISLSEDGAELLSRLADGALRDALSLLDQCMITEGPITASSILDVLGLAGNVQTAELCQLLLTRQKEPALMLMNRLYSDGKDVAAILNELSTLCRDLLIRLTAPNGGEILMSGGYERTVLDQLLSLTDSKRLLYMTEQLQRSSAALASSNNRRTDAELCILRLCDESLCGDPDALGHRLSRLESMLSGGVPVIPAHPTTTSEPAPNAKAPAQPAVPEKKGPVIPAGKEAAPVMPQETPVDVPKKKPAAPAKGSSDAWNQLLTICKSQMPIHRRIFLNQSQGVLEKDTLTIYCDNDTALTSLQAADAYDVIRSAVTNIYGEGISLSLISGTPPAGVSPSEENAGTTASSALPKEDKFKDLIHFSQQFSDVKFE